MANCLPAPPESGRVRDGHACPSRVVAHGIDERDGTTAPSGSSRRRQGRRRESAAVSGARTELPRDRSEHDQSSASRSAAMIETSGSGVEANAERDRGGRGRKINEPGSSAHEAMESAAAILACFLVGRLLPALRQGLSRAVSAHPPAGFLTRSINSSGHDPGASIPRASNWIRVTEPRALSARHGTVATRGAPTAASRLGPPSAPQRAHGSRRTSTRSRSSGAAGAARSTSASGPRPMGAPRGGPGSQPWR